MSSVRVFEAAARLGSFKKAAEELNITASAVSHAVQNLEDWLGVALFQRGGGSSDHRARCCLRGAVGDALKAVAEATARLPGGVRRDGWRSAPHRGLPPAGCCRDFAIHRTQSGNWSDIETSLKAVDLPMEGIDAAIRLAAGVARDAVWTRLLDDPRAGLLAEPDGEACRPRRAQPHGTVAPTHPYDVRIGDWAEWFRLVGAAPSANVRAGLRVDTANMAIEAARRGYGIALGRTPLFDAEIKLASLSACSIGVPSGWCYWLVTMDMRIFRART